VHAFHEAALAEGAQMMALPEQDLIMVKLIMDILSGTWMETR